MCVKAHRTNFSHHCTELFSLASNEGKTIFSIIQWLAWKRQTLCKCFKFSRTIIINIRAPLYTLENFEIVFLLFGERCSCQNIFERLLNWSEKCMYHLQLIQMSVSQAWWEVLHRVRLAFSSNRRTTPPTTRLIECLFKHFSQLIDCIASYVSFGKVCAMFVCSALIVGEKLETFKLRAPKESSLMSNRKSTLHLATMCERRTMNILCNGIAKVYEFFNITVIFDPLW